MFVIDKDIALTQAGMCLKYFLSLETSWYKSP